MNVHSATMLNLDRRVGHPPSTSCRRHALNQVANGDSASTQRLKRRVLKCRLCLIDLTEWRAYCSANLRRSPSTKYPLNPDMGIFCRLPHITKLSYRNIRSLSSLAFKRGRTASTTAGCWRTKWLIRILSCDDSTWSTGFSCCKAWRRRMHDLAGAYRCLEVI